MTTYIVDLYRTMAQSLEIEADSPEEAEQKALDSLASTVWHLQDLTDEVEVVVSGELGHRFARALSDGERQYY